VEFVRLFEVASTPIFRRTIVEKSSISLTSYRFLNRTLHIQEPVQLTFDLSKLQRFFIMHKPTKLQQSAPRIADLLKAPKIMKTQSLFSAFLIPPIVVLTCGVDDAKLVMALQ